MKNLKIEFIEQINTSHFNPQFARTGFHSLDGMWECNGKRIRVPFAPEAALSEFAGRHEVLDEQWNGRLSYTTSFWVPKDYSFPRILLHFGAVDQVTDVYLNGTYIGHHDGGYLAFSFDITPVIKKDGVNELRVEVTDLLSTSYPYGKQKKKRGGMWYTPVSGIWKSVWIENVPDVYVDSFTIKTDLNSADFELGMSDGTKLKKVLNIDNPHLWTPDDPYLYPIRITYGEDCIYSYFALRTVSIKLVNGVNRVCLNEKPIFMNGVLDQGYWEDGIYTPLSDEKYTQDILSMKELGFNMLRMHVKVEAAKFYFECDRNGMLICQDMVENGKYHYLRDTVFPYLGIMRRDNKKRRIDAKEKARRDFFIEHCRDTIKELYNHPSIIMYTIFNEGWGQFESDKVYDIMKKEDDSRLWDTTSGWFKHQKSDFDSEHIYFRNKQLKPKQRPLFLKECGGYSYIVKEHIWNTKRSYGYGAACKSKEELTQKIVQMYEEMVIPAIKDGLCGCIYTQLNDIEDEVNGIYTYDRKVCKVNKDQIIKEFNKISVLLDR